MNNAIAMHQVGHDVVREVAKKHFWISNKGAKANGTIDSLNK